MSRVFRILVLALALISILAFSLIRGCGSPGNSAAAEVGVPEAASMTDRPHEPEDRVSINQKPLSLPLITPRIVISKSARQLRLLSNNETVRIYPVGLGQNPVDDKRREGDRSTPEGTFYLTLRNPDSQFDRSLGISYPNREDAERGLRDGLITEREYRRIIDALSRKEEPPQHTPLGGDIYIHGGGSAKDWTWGCIALDDENVRELYRVAEEGMEIVIEK